MWLYIVFLIIGLLINQVLVITSPKPLIDKTIFIIIIYLFFYMLSAFFLSNVIMLRKPKTIKKEIEFNLSSKKIELYGILFFLIGSLVYLSLYLKIGFIPLLSDETALLRHEAKAGLGKYAILGTALLYTPLYFFVASYNRLSLLFKFIFFFMLLIALLLISGIAFRGPVAYLLLSMLLIRFYMSDKYKRSLRVPKYYILYGIVFILLLSIVDFIRGGHVFNIFAFRHVFITLNVNIYNLNSIVDFFPAFHNYYYGKTFISDLLVAFPGSDNRFLGVMLKDVMDFAFVGEGITVTAPGEGYVNWGMFGVIIHAIFVGLFSGMIFNVLSGKNTLSSRVILFIFAINISRIVLGGIMPTLMFSLGPLLLLSLIFIHITKERKGKR